MKKEYEIVQTRNGFLIRFKHEKDSYDEANRYVARDLHEVMYILGEDMKSEPDIEY